MIVVDPRRTKTAELADIHLQVKPGTDAWLLSAMVAVLVQEGLVDRGFLDAHAAGVDEVVAHFADIPVAEYCAHTGVAEDLVRDATRRIAKARSVASFEDLGVQMNRHSTLVSYLHRLLWLLTGNLGKEGTQYAPTPLLAIADGVHKRDSPVVGARIVGGLVPCNVIAEEILTDHEKRYRAMIVEAANPAHSLADTSRMSEALRSLDTLVVIDVALSETARLADYVLPASTQFEKAEATFFNLEFPKNYFHLRPALLSAPDEGPLPEAEIHARLVEELGLIDQALVAELRAAAEEGLSVFADAFMAKVAFHPSHSGLAPVLLYRSLGPTLPEGLREGAVLFGLAARCAIQSPASLGRAGFKGTPAETAIQLFEAIMKSPSGVVFAVDVWDDVLGRIGTPNKKVQLALPDLLEECAGLAEGPETAHADFPFVLSAGERRSFTANTIVRDPNWRRKDADGSLRVNPSDAAALGVATGDSLRLSTARGSAVVTVEVSDTMQRGHISLPNGMGLQNRPEELGGDEPSGGVAPNELTALEARDPFVGTPWHKHVPARLEAV
ncbi:MAG: molybdopterin dinucleotide binding domain-containing protein, partial [Myxococcota bacterium]